MVLEKAGLRLVAKTVVRIRELRQLLMQEE